ncbi:hypothetical protein BaRGS_00014883 [Batillaria attramentaria]|uniref:Uncharacterized protein n=1 Tax=Batillaria attramentaria TaxID=370345 RepID=A0ABD0L434_9CAEN
MEFQFLDQRPSAEEGRRKWRVAPRGRAGVHVVSGPCVDETRLQKVLGAWASCERGRLDVDWRQAACPSPSSPAVGLWTAATEE